MMSNTMEGWLMVLISSMACVLGATVVFLGRNIIESQHFLSSSMAMGGGVLVFNSLYTLLPAASEKLNHSDFETFSWFFVGVLLTAFLSRLIQYLTPHAIHTCEPNKHHTEPVLSEQRAHTEYGSVTLHHHENDPADKADYFLIGIQTAIAICIHKFPEGLVMFVSNRSSNQLGLSVAAAITIHNCIEGFLISLPLFYATGSRLAAFAYASLLGGLSQPLGAIIGLLVIHKRNQLEEEYIGMMCYVAIQSMIPQAIRADTSDHCVPLFFFAGIFLVGLTSLLHSI
ncbi:Zinc/iron permease [Blakeslea trispora]|nr:Zinc/iron permease [Blakeslea trispora]